MDDGFLPVKRLREMEITANSMLNTYRNLYFESGHSSAYFFDTDDDSETSFGATFLIHKGLLMRISVF